MNNRPKCSFEAKIVRLGVGATLYTSDALIKGQSGAVQFSMHSASMRRHNRKLRIFEVAQPIYLLCMPNDKILDVAEMVVLLSKATKREYPFLESPPPGGWVQGATIYLLDGNAVSWQVIFWAQANKNNLETNGTGRLGSIMQPGATAIIVDTNMSIRLPAKFGSKVCSAKGVEQLLQIPHPMSVRTEDGASLTIVKANEMGFTIAEFGAEFETLELASEQQTRLVPTSDMVFMNMCEPIDVLAWQIMLGLPEKTSTIDMFSKAKTRMPQINGLKVGTNKYLMAFDAMWPNFVVLMPSN